MATVVRRCKCPSKAAQANCRCPRDVVRWRARHGQGKDEISRTFWPRDGGEKAANTWLATVVADKARGTFIDHRDGRRLLKDWAVEWQQAQLHARNTASVTDWALNVHIIPAFGDKPVGRVTRLQVQQWVRSLEQQGYAPATIHTAYAKLAALMLAASYEVPPLIPASPCVRIRLPALDRTERPFVDEHQLLALAGGLGHYGLLAVTAFYTGMRWSELAGLRLLPDDVDLLRSRLRVLDPGREPGAFGPQKEVRGLAFHGRPKTPSSRRDISLPPFLVKLLGEWQPRRQPCAGCGSPHLFVGPMGKPLRRNAFHPVWRPVADAVMPGLHVHDLRASHKALLQNERIPDFAIDKRLGHSRSDVRDRYSRLTGEVEKDLLVGLERRWRQSVEKRATG